MATSSKRDGLIPVEPRLSVQIEPLLLSRSDAARVLGISPRKLDDWVAAGLVSKWKVDGVVRFSTEELRRFVEQMQTSARPS